MGCYHQDVPFAIPKDPYAERPSVTTAAQVERELGEEDGLEGAARYLLGKYNGDRRYVIRMLRRWTAETGNLRWDLVADHIELMPLPAEQVETTEEYRRYLAGVHDPRD